ncbi:MAG TPA: hypothetical protein VF883_13255 [Thermoanaerobaculia bacterium]|jgi:hypothetical protein
MSEHPTTSALESYRARSLAPRELLSVDRHIVTCAECRARIARPAAETAARWREALTAAEARPRRSRVLWLAAAALLLLAFAALLFVRREEPVVPRRGPLVRTTPPPAPVPAPEPAPEPALDPALQSVVAALEKGTLSGVTLAASLRPMAEQQRSGSTPADEAVEIVEPAGVVVETARPTFAWRVQSATEARVQIFDRGYTLVRESPPLQTTSWQPREPLPRGATYRWQVVLRDASGEPVAWPAPPEPPAQFAVISARGARELADARTAGDAVAEGLIAMREGLVAEGARILARHAAAHPRSAEAARLARLASAAAIDAAAPAPSTQIR